MDTNILISRHWGGLPGEVLDAWVTGRYELLVSQPILQEMAGVLARKRGDWDAEQNMLSLFRVLAEMVEPRVALDVVAEDESDNRFLECAVEGRADYLVSGDAHLLNLREFRGVKILTPRAFLDILAA